ncbi:MAG: hypothetical protein J3R72DRAFT_427490 [Linnemannia gamsii]|nr:MAG: hypothetical protein J3R72DRAFT_427490 [Linnemannia gamsii]
MPETVWAIHNFEAEAEDEISFHIGEPITVLQKDDLYQDGWWEGTNVRGETGLFPVNYTVRELAQRAITVDRNPAIASPPPSNGRNVFGPSSGASTPSGGAPNSKVIAQSVEESLNDPQLVGHPSTWSIDQVAYWLRWCGFANIAPSFIDNEISGAILLELNLNNLKELEINSFGKRFNIMNAITSLKQATKGDQGGKGQFTGLTNSVGAMFAGAPGGPNIPPRMTSAVGGSPRASTYDPRNDYMQDPRQDPRGAPMSPPASVQSPSMRQQQPVHPSEFDMHSRNNTLARSDTMGSISGGSTGDHNGRGGQRQSITSAYSSTSGPQRNQWERNAPRPPQMPSPAPHPMEQSMEQYPRPMDRVAPTSPEMYHQEQFSPEPQYQQLSPPQQRQRAHAPPDTANRPMNGKADPVDKVVSLDNIGKPDYAGWLKKRGDTYRTWKSRWFMLKGVTLYYMNSPKDNASKDYINLVGYKIIQDENIYAGKYCFKAVHEDLRNFYFYTESEQDMKGWLKALMKVTIGRDPSAPVISSSNIPTIPLHVARRMAPRPPSPSKRNRGVGPNGQGHDQESPVLQSLSPEHQHQQQQRRSFLQGDDNNLSGHDDPWRDEDDEGFGQQQAPQPRHQQQQHLKNMRPDSELDTFRQHGDDQNSAPRQSPVGQRWTQEQYIDWMNRNLPESAGPVNDMTQSLRSGVVLVRLIEQLSGEQVDKRIPNATYTLQMLENLLTAFKFMDRVGVSTDGYTVKDIFNGNEEKIVQMFESIRARFPHDASQAKNGHSQNLSQSNGMKQNGSLQPQHLQPQHTGGSEYEALYEEAARSTIG